MPRLASIPLTLAALVAVSACCSTPPAPTPRAETPTAATDPDTVSPPPTDVVDTTAPMTSDCSPAPSRMCCRAMTAECLACVEQAKAEWKAFIARCPQVGVGPPSFDIDPPTRQVVGVDCSKPLEPVMCCQAETPSCQACRANAERLDKNWQATCGPAGFAPPDTTYDCSRPAPVTPCCRALLPKCTDCVDRNRVIEAEYAIACPGR